MNANVRAADSVTKLHSSVSYVGSGTGHRTLVDVLYNLELLDSNGVTKWADSVRGTVVIAGLNKLLDACFKTGLASPAWFVGLLDGATAPVVTPSDTMASHAGWIENVGVSNSVRPTLTPGTIANGAVDNSGSRAVFNITADGSIAGAFVASNSALSGASGVLYDVGAFLDGVRPVSSGDVLQITVTLSVSAA